MKELSLHVLDLLRNSAKAGARRAVLYVREDRKAGVLELCVEDDGRGMDGETLDSLCDPLSGGAGSHLGVPLLADTARRCGGGVRAGSVPGRGTMVRALFSLSHPDLPPMGDLAGTLATVKALHPAMSVAVRYGAAAEELEKKFDGFENSLEDGCLR